MRFNRLAVRDFSSSPEKWGGASHCRMFVHMVELLNTTGNFEGLYNNFYLAAMEKSALRRPTETAVEPLERIVACKFLPVEFTPVLIFAPMLDQSGFEFDYDDTMIAPMQLEGVLTEANLFFSNTSTRWPRRASPTAVLKPDSPAPAIRTMLGCTMHLVVLECPSAYCTHEFYVSHSTPG